MNIETKPKKAESQQGPRLPRRRAAKACEHCRIRKARCNVTESGPPCARCASGGLECLTRPTRSKHKLKVENSRDIGPTAPSGLPVEMVGYFQQLFDNGLDIETTGSFLLPNEFRSEDCNRPSYVPHSAQKLSGLARACNSPASAGMQRVTEFDGQLQDFYMSSTNTFGRSDHLPPLMPEVCSATDIPFYIKPLPANLGIDEITYLQSAGALSLPAPPLRNLLFQAFFDFVYPYNPIFDFHNFLVAMNTPDGSRGQVSLILMHAIMSAGSSFVEMQSLHIAGYTTRQEAQREFFRKTKLLHDFDYETDRLVLVQALLLSTYFHESPGDHRSAWYWMGIITSIACDIGLHRDSKSDSIDSETFKFRKRTWWSIYMRDRLLSLGTHRPMNIDDRHLDIPIPTIEDFDYKPLPIDILPNSIYLHSQERQQQLAIMCIEKIKLCQNIGSILSKHHGMISHPAAGIREMKGTIHPNASHCSEQDFREDEKRLLAWIDQQPMVARYIHRWSGDAVINLHRTVIYILFYGIWANLHYPQSTANDAAPTQGERTAQVRSLERMRQSANLITTAVAHLDSMDLVRFLPISSLTALVPSIITHLFYAKAPHEQIRHTSLRGISQCMQAMDKLRDLYPAADHLTTLFKDYIDDLPLTTRSTFPVNISKPPTKDRSPQFTNLERHNITPLPSPNASDDILAIFIPMDDASTESEFGE